MECDLLPLNVHVEVSEPWDCPLQSFDAQILMTGKGEVWGGDIFDLSILRSKEPLNFRGVDYVYFVISWGKKDNVLPFLLERKEVNCVLTGISEEKFLSETRFNISDWRGGTPSLRVLLRLNI